jgi:hypothetical protein
MRILVLLLITVFSYLAPATDCTSVFQERKTGTDQFIYIVEVQGKKGNTTDLHHRVFPSNIEQIFTHQYDKTAPHRFGAKAIAVEIQPGVLHVFFFASGKGEIGNNIHHRDALSKTIEHSESYNSQLTWKIAELFELYTQRIGTPGSDNQFQVDRVLQKSLKRSSHIETAVADLQTRTNRGSSGYTGFSRGLIQKSQGYQFTAEIVNGQLKIVEMQIDSSITSAQISQQIEVRRSLQERLLDATLDRISPELVEFERPSFPEGLNFR